MLTFMFPTNTSRGFGFNRVENTLDSLQKVVGGYIQVITLKDDLVMIVDEEGKIKNKRYNVLADCIFKHYYPTTKDFIVGNAVLLTTKGETFSDFEMKYYKEVIEILREEYSWI